MATNQFPIPAELAEIIATHKALFGGFTMMADVNDETPPSEAPAEQEPTADDLGDAGKRALAAERRRAKQAEKLATDLQAQLDKIADADKTETQKAADRATKAEQDRDAALSELAALRLEQSVYRNAGAADPLALLDSRAFLDAIADLDASDDKAMQAAVKDALKTNPRFGRPGKSGGDLHEGQQQRHHNPETAAPGVHRMAAAFDAQLGNNP